MEGADDQAPVVAWMEHHQVVLYLGALVAGAVLGLAAPAASSLLEAAVSPVLVALLYTTFLGVPFHRLRAAFAEHVAPALGWQPNTAGPVTGCPPEA